MICTTGGFASKVFFMNFSTLATKPPSLLKTEAVLWKLNDIRLLIDNVNLHYVNPDQHVGRTCESGSRRQKFPKTKTNYNYYMLKTPQHTTKRI